MAVAAEIKAASPDAGKRYASVWRVRGIVSASGGVAVNARQLQVGDPVFVGERVYAAPTGEAVLKTDDAGIVAVRPGAEFIAERFAAQGDANDSLTLRVLTGSLRVISGWIGRTNRSGHRIVTPTATIGIRGTDYEPYVLSADMAAETAAKYKPGTYDKVNRGVTTLEANGHSIDVDAGKVGFARLAGVKERALMTILLPVLLDKVPDFYVPGEFDAELDRYSQTADEASLQQLDLKRKGAAAETGAACAPDTIAKSWLDKLDGSIANGDATAIIAMFAPEVAVRATVIQKDGSTATVNLGREELAQSTLAAMKELQGYKQRRISLDAKAADPETCKQLNVKSVVIEQGVQAGKQFRFESAEEYLLELRGDNWLAIKAETTQR